MKKQFYGYTRVSSVKQGEGVSLDAQKEAIERYATQHGLTVSNWFQETETAAKQGRPIFTKMIKDLHTGRADGLIMHKIDRSARNLRDWAKIGDLQDAGVSVHFAAESVDFASRGGRLTADIQAVIAADYIRNLKEEIKKGQHGRLKQGLYPFTAPFGYLDQGKGNAKTIDPVRGPILRKMFELYASGEYSFNSLEQELWKRGLRSIGNCKVYKGKIELILANPFYAGLIKLESYDEVFQGQHEPLISLELFRQVQEVKKRRSHKKKTKHNHLYRGVFKCRACTNAMIPERQRGHVYYRCHTKVCPSNSIRETAIDWSVLRALSGFHICPKQIDQFTERLGQWLSQSREPVTNHSNDFQLNQTRAQRERLTDGYLEGLVDAQTYKSRKESLQFRQLELMQKAKNVTSNEDKAANALKFLEHAKTFARTYFYADHAEKRQMLNLFFSNTHIWAKNVELEPRNWLCPLLGWDGVPFGAPHDGTNRSRIALEAMDIQCVLDVLDCSEIREFSAISDKLTPRSNLPELHKPSNRNFFLTSGFHATITPCQTPSKNL